MSANASPTRWLFGPVPDLLLGCGVGYLLLAALHLAIGAALPASIPGGLLILLFSLPHYGATLVRVYESAEDRARYRVLAVHATLALAIVFVASLHVTLVGSLVLTIYLTWSPWHYTGQNYGIALMMLGRRGVALDAATKRWIHLSFVASFALSFLALHGAQPGGSYAPVRYDDTTIRLLPLGIPFDLAAAAISVVAVGYLVTVTVAVARLLRAGSLAALAPAGVLVATQAIWFSLPVVLRMTGWAAGSPGPESPLSAYGFLWVASAHSVQYLWVTLYYVITADPGRSRVGFLASATLAGFAVWIVPGLLFAPGLLGGVTYDSGLALVVASIVNLHHFILDGAIWKLRDGRIARVLLRSGEADADVPGTSSRGPWLRWAVSLAGGVSIAVAAVGFYESEFGFGRALRTGDWSRAETAIERFAWIGRDGAPKRVELARRIGAGGDYARAGRLLERAVELEPSAEASHFLGLVREQQGRHDEALAAYEAALELEPGRADTRRQRAGVRLALGDAASAARELEAMIAADPTDDAARALLARARLALRAEARVEAVE